MAKVIRNKVVNAVRSITRDSASTEYGKRLQRKTGRLNKSFRMDRAKTLKQWKKNYPLTVRERVKEAKAKL